MGLISYGFVVRGLSTPTRSRPPICGRSLPGQPRVLKGLTSKVHNHQHEVTVTTDAEGQRSRALRWQQGHWHKIDVEGSGKDGGLHDRSAAGDAAGAGAGLRQVAVQGPRRAGRRKGRQRRRRMDVSQLHRRRDARRRHLDVRGDRRVGVSRRSAGGNDARRVPHVQRRPGSRHPRQPLGRKPDSDQKPVEVRIFPGQEARDRLPIPPPGVDRSPRRQEVRSVPRFRPRREVGDLGAVPCRRASISAWPRPTSTSAPADASFALELRQGLFRHLAADGVGDWPRGDVQHVPERAGGAGGHAGADGGGLLHRLPRRAGVGQD